MYIKVAQTNMQINRRPENSIDRFEIYGILGVICNYMKGGDLVSTEIFVKGEITIGGTGI